MRLNSKAFAFFFARGGGGALFLWLFSLSTSRQHHVNGRRLRELKENLLQLCETLKPCDIFVRKRWKKFRNPQALAKISQILSTLPSFLIPSSPVITVRIGYGKSGKSLEPVYLLLDRKFLKTKNAPPGRVLRSCCRDFERKQFECRSVLSCLFLFIVQTAHSRPGAVCPPLQQQKQKKAPSEQPVSPESSFASQLWILT